MEVFVGVFSLRLDCLHQRQLDVFHFIIANGVIYIRLDVHGRSRKQLVLVEGDLGRAFALTQPQNPAKFVFKVDLQRCQLRRNSLEPPQDLELLLNLDGLLDFGIDRPQLSGQIILYREF